MGIARLAPEPMLPLLRFRKLDLERILPLQSTSCTGSESHRTPAFGSWISMIPGISATSNGVYGNSIPIADTTG